MREITGFFQPASLPACRKCCRYDDNEEQLPQQSGLARCAIRARWPSSRWEPRAKSDQAGSWWACWPGRGACSIGAPPAGTPRVCVRMYNMCV